MTSAQSISFPVSEATIVERFGIAVSELKKLRGTFERDLHWEKSGAGRIGWSEAGILALAQRLSPADETLPAPEKMAAPNAILTVVRARTPRVLHVVLSGQKHDHTHPVCLWLPQAVARLFTPGMKVLGRPRAGRSDLYDYEGNPTPGARRRFPRKIGTW